MLRFERVPAEFRLLLALTVCLVIASTICSAQNSELTNYISFDGPGAGTGTNQGTFPGAITNGGFIGLTVIDGNSISRAYVRTPKGKYISVTPPDSINAYLAGLNSNGQVAGSFYDSSRALHGYFRNRDGTFIQLDPPGSTGLTSVTGMNERGQLAGNFFASGGQLSYFWDMKNPTQYVVFSVSGSTGTIATGINASGEITGLYFDSAGSHAFLRTPDGATTTFDFGGGNTVTGPLLINTPGQITGGVFNMGVDAGFLRARNGHFTFWAAGSHVGPQPQGINDSGVIVGYFFSDAGGNYAFERNAAGHITNLAVPFSNTATQATEINGGGWIIGNYTDANGASHGWLRTRGF